MNIAIVKQTWQAFNEDKAPRLAGSIAYATLLSLAPLFIVLIAITGAILGIGNGGHGHRTAEDALLDQVRRGAGDSAAQTLRQLISASFDKPRQGLIAQIIGWITFVLGAGALFGALQDALNSIWRVEGTHGGWKQMVRDRLASFGMIAVIGFLLLISFGLNAAVTVLGTHFAGVMPFVGGELILHVLSWLVSLGIVTLVFALIFKVLPDIQLSWRDVWQGAVVTAVLFVIGQALVALYFSVAGVASAYGAAGSLLALLLWIYYSALILLLGAEYTKVQAGSAHTTVKATIRQIVERPAGTDPRQA